MADQTIKDILIKLGDGTKNHEVKLDIHKAQLDFWSKLISVGITVVGIILGVMSISGMNKLPDEKTFIYTYLVAEAIVFVSLFLILYHYQAKRMTFYLVKNYTQLKTVLEIFSSLENTYHLKFGDLEKQIIAAKETAKNIANSPLSNLISWEQSGKLELEAYRVFGISIDLSWLNNRQKLDEIYQDLKSKPCDKYYYILTSNSEVALNNLNEIQAYVNSQSIHFPDLKSRFKIIKLIDLKMNDCKIYSDGNFTLPIPNDIVIYKNENGTKTAVVSTSSIQKQRDMSDLMSNYDVKFTAANEVSRIELWFKRTWKLTGENIDDE
jgi:hypothetical protein